MTSRTLAEAGYLATLTLLLILAALQRRRPERLPSAWTALRSLQASTAGRWLLMLGWWWLGWHFFAR